MFPWRARTLTLIVSQETGIYLHQWWGKSLFGLHSSIFFFPPFFYNLYLSWNTIQEQPCINSCCQWSFYWSCDEIFPDFLHDFVHPFFWHSTCYTKSCLPIQKCFGSSIQQTTLAVYLCSLFYSSENVAPNCLK